MPRLYAFFCFALTLPFSNAVAADWVLDMNRSSISFVSVKNANIAEANSFSTMSGAVTSDGVASLEIALDSVDTLISIRNQRVREVLFNTAQFPVATYSGEVPLADVMALASGEAKAIDLSGQLSIRGKTAGVSVPVWVIKTGESRFQVTSIKPVMLNAGQFDLLSGLNSLKEIAGLQSITAMVPVSFSLAFVKTGH